VTGQPVLELKLDVADGLCNITADYGEDSVEREVDMLPDNFRSNVAKLQEAILRSVPTRASQPDLRASSATTNSAAPSPEIGQVTRLEAVGAGAQLGMIQEIGAELFDFVFQRKIKDLYEKSCNAAFENRTTVLIKLSTTSAALASLPWETLFDKGRRHFVAVSGFFRVVPTGMRRAPRVNRTPLRILGMAAGIASLNGIPVDRIQVDPEQNAMKEAMAALEKDGGVRMRWLASARAKDINLGIAGGNDGAGWDIFHFIGHGGYDRDQNMGFIVVQEGGGSQGVRLYSDDLKNLLIQPDRTPSLVVLNSCSGAATDPSNLFSSTAVDLIAGGIDAVVAMQFEISDRMAIRFSEAFYTYLSLGKPLQEAMARTRVDLKAAGYAEWISPVLYMNVSGGTMIVDDGREPPDTFM
jgi:hypothetical protein